MQTGGTGGGFPSGTPVSSHTKSTQTQTSVPTRMIYYILG